MSVFRVLSQGAFICLLVSGFVGQTHADLIAYWNQNSNSLPVSGFGFTKVPDDFPQAADAGVGSGVLSVGGGLTGNSIVNVNGTEVYEWIESFGGDAQNALFSDAAGGSIAMEGGTGTANNNAYFQFQFNMAGYKDLAVSYATRGTTSGFSTHTWSWSTDGVAFTNFGTIAGRNVTSWSTQSLSTLAALDNASNAYLRLTFSGATTAAGNNRLDNIQFNATAVPEPTSAGLLALTGVAGLAFRRRRS
jgi:hypothetical protein